REDVPPLIRRRMRLLASGQDDAEPLYEVTLKRERLVLPVFVRLGCLNVSFQDSAFEEVRGRYAMALGEARDDDLAALRWLLALCRVRDAADVGHAREVIHKIEIVCAALADRFEVVGHTRGAVDDADVLGSAALARGFVNDVADLGEPGRLEPVPADWFE